MSATSGERLIGLCAVLYLSCGEGLMHPELPPADAPRACNDGADNDGDGRTDFPAEPGCSSPVDPAELDPEDLPACSDGVDNDGDGRIDFDRDNDGVLDPEDDPGCASASSDSELNLVLPACADGIDNDDDTFTDYPADPECANRNDTDEAQ